MVDLREGVEQIVISEAGILCHRKYGCLPVQLGGHFVLACCGRWQILLACWK